MEAIKFGHLAKRYNLESLNWRIETLPETKDYHEFLQLGYLIKDGWIYPPIELYNINGIDKPLRSAPWFGLPPSHKLVINEKSDQIQRTLILYLGFLEGLHLIPKGWGYLQRTAINPGKLVVFLANDKEKKWLIDTALSIAKKADSDLIIHLNSLIQWFLISQSYMHKYEEFEAQYRVIDVAYWLAKKMGYINKNKCKHVERLQKLCEAFEIPLPKWGEVINNQSI